MDAFCALG